MSVLCKKEQYNADTTCNKTAQIIFKKFILVAVNVNHNMLGGMSGVTLILQFIFAWLKKFLNSL